MDPKSRFLYVSGDKGYDRFTISQDGRLQAQSMDLPKGADGSPVAAPWRHGFVDRSGSFLYAEAEGGLCRYRLDGNGKLLDGASQDLSLQFASHAFIVTPNGKFVYLLNSYNVTPQTEVSGIIAAVVASDGSVHRLPDAQIPSDLDSLFGDPTGHYLAGLNDDSAIPGSYSHGMIAAIEYANGTLTPLPALSEPGSRLI